MPEDYPFDILHPHLRRITTSDPSCQEWFGRGLTWIYGFNHGEAMRCFSKALEHDPHCVMAYWGMAYSIGPNFNKPWRLFDAEDMEVAVASARRNIEQALRYVEAASIQEQALVRALALRFAGHERSIDPTTSDECYVQAMREAAIRHPTDLDIIALYGESILTMIPKTVWSEKSSNGEALSLAHELDVNFQQAFSVEGAGAHAGLNHMYIHLLERSPHPEKAEPAADRLRDGIRDAGHLQHMPAHIDILLGNYGLAITANANAVRADEKFSETGLNGGPMFPFYRAHNCHSLIYAAMLAGQYAVALAATEKLECALPETTLRIESPPMADWLEAFHGVRVHVLIRFGKWSDILGLAMPTDPTLYSVTTATLWYGRGIAHAALGDIDQASEARDRFLEACARVPVSRMDYPNKSRDVFKVAEAMLDGELQYRCQSYESAFASLEKAIALDDALVYSEPWAWMLPSRHPYAALKLEQGHTEEALVAYQMDLGLDDPAKTNGVHHRRHPKNIWALTGYVDCLKRLDRWKEAELAETWLEKAALDSDIDIRSSCYCKRGLIRSID
jgi:tetratricopeptide (TPR) repeat protein